MGLIHYSFKGPALTGQAISATENVLPATPGMVDIDFPVRFTERPLFTQSFEHAENQDHASGFSPMMASVVSWKTGRRSETGLPFYDGARVLISAPQVTAAPAAVSGSEPPLIVLGMFSDSIPVGSGKLLEWETPEGSEFTTNLGGAFTFDPGQPDRVTVNDACYIDIDVYIYWQPEPDGVFRGLTITGHEGLPTTFRVANIDGHGVSLSAGLKVGCEAGDHIFIGCFHDVGSPISVSDGWLGITRLYLL